MPYLSLLSLLFLLATPQARTVVLTGTVTDAETGLPVEGAHVFIAASMMGDITDANGRYRLDRVPLGSHRLYASRLGYAPQQQDLYLRDEMPEPVDFRLTPRPVEGPEVEIQEDVDQRWLRRWNSRKEKFLRLFIGEGPSADSCHVLNPEVLSFENTWSAFTATAEQPLVIENRHLGYRITYFLELFELEGTMLTYDGEPLFEEMEPRSPLEKTLWDLHRLQAYRGSFRHFLHALMAGAAREEGFVTFRRPNLEHIHSSRDRWLLDPDRILRAREDSPDYLLDFEGFAEVIYMHEMEDESFRRWQQWHPTSSVNNQRSWVKLERGPALVDRHGEVPDPKSVVLYGYFAFERVADQLPKEYRPGTERSATPLHGEDEKRE